jgi:hypothetical protein
MRLRTVVAAIAALASSLTLAACGAGGASRSSPTPQLNSGIVVSTVLGPTCPVERAGENCTAPISVKVAVIARDGSTVATVQTDASGRATVPLIPGQYDVSGSAGASGNTFPRAPAPVPVTVRIGTYAPVQLMYDTGIR